MSLISRKVDNIKVFDDICKGDIVYNYKVNFYGINITDTIDDIISKMKKYCEAIATNYMLIRNEPEFAYIKCMLIANNNEVLSKIKVTRNKI